MKNKALLPLIALVILGVFVSGCTGTSSKPAMTGQYADPSVDHIVTFEGTDTIGYVGLNGAGDEQFYGGKYSVDGNDIIVTLNMKKVSSSGAFQHIDELKLIFKIVDDTHIKTPGGVILIKHP